MEVGRQFVEVHGLIVAARQRAFKSVNQELIRLYWDVGEYIALRVGNSEWEKVWSVP